MIILGIIYYIDLILGYSGKGVKITILDDGIEWKHPDLITNYATLATSILWIEKLVVVIYIKVVIEFILD